MSIESLINDFSFLDGWEDRYKYLIELGGQLPRFSDEQKKTNGKFPAANPRFGLSLIIVKTASVLKATAMPLSSAELLPSFWKYLKISLHKKF